VARDPLHEVGLGLVRDHLDDIGEVLALGGELDDLTVHDLAAADDLEQQVSVAGVVGQIANLVELC